MPKRTFLQRWRDMVAERVAGTARHRRGSSWCIGRCDAACDRRRQPTASKPTRPVARGSPVAGPGTAAATGC